MYRFRRSLYGIVLIAVPIGLGLSIILLPFLLITEEVGLWTFLIFPLLVVLYIGYRCWEWWRNRLLEKARIEAIRGLRNRCSTAEIDAMLDKRIAIGFDANMVKLAWGDPKKIQSEISKSGVTKQRWVYGIPKPGKPAKYVHFTNGKVVRIKA